jgi:hypothetical protein
MNYRELNLQIPFVDVEVTIVKKRREKKRGEVFVKKAWTRDMKLEPCDEQISQSRSYLRTRLDLEQKRRFVDPQKGKVV